MIDIRLRSKVSAAELEAKVGKIITDDDYNVLLTGPTFVRKPDGKPLCVFLPGAMTEHATADVYEIFHGMRKAMTDNRGLAGGTKRVETPGQKRSRAAPVASAIIGSIDPGGVYKYCRLTAWTGENLPEWERLRPFLSAVGAYLERYVPDRYASQLEQARKAPPEWVVPGTPFSTVTVNNCVDPATEALSRTQGWVTHDQLTIGEDILAFDPKTGTTRWEPLLDLFVNEDYRGEMAELSARGFSALTTPDHRWPLQAPNTSRGSKANLEMTVKVTRDLPNGYWSILRAAPHEATTFPCHSDAFVRIAAWYFTEGSLLRGGKSVSICQSARVNPLNVDAIRSELKLLGARPSSEAATQHGGPRRIGLFVNDYLRADGMNVWVLTGTDVDALLAAIPGADKVPSPAFLASLDFGQLALFVETCLEGDGSPQSRRFYQYHKGRMDAFVAAATLAGLAPAVDSTGTHCFLRQSRSGNVGARINLRSVRRESIEYEGVIWCPRVPSSHWVARRSGSVYITGNSYPTGVHTDKGDLEAGFSTIACLRRGEFTGGRLAFPEYRVAVDMHDGDLILMDAHEWHGNTAIVCACGTRLNTCCPTCGAERISVVTYFRAKIAACGTFEQELERAARLREKRPVQA